MIKRSYWLALLLLSGCVSQPMMQQKVTVPNKIEFEQQQYQLSKTDDLGSVVKYTYELMNKDQQAFGNFSRFTTEFCKNGCEISATDSTTRKNVP